ncbi:MAG: FixH family protein [Elusimicrobiota bacterium]|jgi:hypothetical protein|nr:FixH family protein [Elusimicrobiota bacterium]
MKKILFIYVYCCCFTIIFGFANIQTIYAHAQSQDTQSLKENTKIAINDNYYFKYTFPEKIKIGNSVIKISIFDKNDKKVDTLKIIGSYDMPSMRGNHSFINQTFQKNKNSDYLLPLNLVMRGEWEIILIIQENNENIYNGAILFKV